MMFKLILCSLAVFLGRLAALLCRLAGREATSLPGYIALKVYPGLLGQLARGLSPVIIVTGTNGKTTTSNLLARLLAAQGRQVVSNGEGANMPAGVATALLKGARGKGHGPAAVLEVDEGSLGIVLRQVSAHLVVVTNLLRDQLDRYHELDQLASSIKGALAQVPEARLLLNADDPLVASLGGDGREVIYYSLERTPLSRTRPADVLEGHLCPSCRVPLAYTYYHYGHLGSYRCPHCGWARPEGAFRGEDFHREEDGFSLDFVFNDGRIRLTSPLPGVYNAYNVLAAGSAGMLLGVEPSVIREVVKDFRPGRGRVEGFRLAGKEGVLVLVKNPVGMAEALRTVAGNRPAAYVVAINDLAADGRDVSWLWDVDLEPLLKSPYARIICSGLRAWDMAVCLKYSGVSLEALRVIPDLEAALREAVEEPVDYLIILSTYTNLALCRRLLKGMGAQSEAAYMPPVSRPA
ncbi:MAG: UDP-N-acetylmuramyl tripeptide synthase [Moorella sp. 60_41]|nr:MAG: UDP-N-acetylmuramyl tripeptide synthase [Moorella sp. 60_41]